MAVLNNLEQMPLISINIEINSTDIDLIELEKQKKFLVATKSIQQ